MAHTRRRILRQWLERLEAATALLYFAASVTFMHFFLQESVVKFCGKGPPPDLHSKP